MNHSASFSVSFYQAHPCKLPYSVMSQLGQNKPLHLLVRENRHLIHEKGMDKTWTLEYRQEVTMGLLCDAGRSLSLGWGSMDVQAPDLSCSLCHIYSQVSLGSWSTGLLYLEKTHHLLYAELFRIASAQRQWPASSLLHTKSQWQVSVLCDSEGKKNEFQMTEGLFWGWEISTYFLRTRKSLIDLRGKATVLFKHYSFQHLPIQPREPETLSAMRSHHKWTVTLLRRHCRQRLRMPFYFGMDEVVSPFTAGQHHVAAGVAQVDVGLAGFPLAPQSQAQMTAITALLQQEETVSDKDFIPSPSGMSPHTHLEPICTLAAEHLEKHLGCGWLQTSKLSLCLVLPSLHKRLNCNRLNTNSRCDNDFGNFACKEVTVPHVTSS